MGNLDIFRIRLNCVDYYQATPHETFAPPLHLFNDGRSCNSPHKVSVLRVFGSTKTGQKVVAHIHGAFQYMYIEYKGSLARHDVDVAIRTLQQSIDHALAVSYQKNIHHELYRYVPHISMVKGVPFYGYHVGYKFYLKIYLLNPVHMIRLADLLREGAVTKKPVQPYESHLQYIAQWMCDYNLYGCSYMECQRVKFRSPVPAYADQNNGLHEWHDRSIPSEDISDEYALPKQSHCALEVDVCVQHILNRHHIRSRPIHHDIVERIEPI